MIAKITEPTVTAMANPARTTSKTVVPEALPVAGAPLCNLGAGALEGAGAAVSFAVAAVAVSGLAITLTVGALGDGSALGAGTVFAVGGLIGEAASFAVAAPAPESEGGFATGGGGGVLAAGGAEGRGVFGAVAGRGAAGLTTPGGAAGGIGVV